MINECEFHPLAGLFPLLEGDEFDELVADIKANGLHKPIVIFDEQILDGRNRYRACLKAGVKPRFENYTGDDPLGYVVSLNLKRRHLTSKQKRELIAKLLKAKPEQSDRQIADQARADHKTVGKVRREQEDVGNIPHVETRTDTRGRKQPAQKKVRSKATKSKCGNTRYTSIHVRLRHARKRVAELESENKQLRARIAELERAAATSAHDGLDIPPELRRAAP